MGGNYERSVFKQMEEMEARMKEQMRRMEERHAENILAVERRYETLLKKKQEEVENYKKRAETAEHKAIELEAKIEKLENEIARLKSNNSNNSENSSLPPSTDQRPSKTKAVNEYNGRRKNIRKSGGQVGHTGETLKMEEMKQRLENQGIHPELLKIGKPGKKWKDRLLIDIPIGVKATIMRFYADENGKIRIPHAYENEVTYGKNIRSLVVYLYGQGVQSLDRTTELIAGLTNNIIHLSEGTVSNWLDQFHDAAISAKTVIENHLLNGHQVNTDGTNVTENGHLSYIRNFSTKDWVLYVSMASKGHKALSKIAFLQRYTGVLMHDHETSLFRYGLEHAECNVHLLRYLRKNAEDTQHKWSKKLAAMLAEMNEYVKCLKAQGRNMVPDATLLRLEKRYDELLDYGASERKEHPCRFHWASKEEKALFNRLKKYKKHYLLFLHDFFVSFDNNMSERDLRKCKNRQKMSGGFRTSHGKDIFCSILSVIETCKRQSLDIFNSISKVFAFQPLFS